jgi:hypothetical protein
MHLGVLPKFREEVGAIWSACLDYELAVLAVLEME